MSGHAQYPPVGGVNWDTYCRVSYEAAFAAANANPGVSGAANQNAPEWFAQTAARWGIPLLAWQRAQLVWGARSALDPDLALKQMSFMQQAMTPPGMAGMLAAQPLPRPPARAPVDAAAANLQPVQGVPIEDYVRYLRDRFTGASVDERWNPIALEWGSRIMSDPNVQTRYYQLVCGYLA